MRLGKDMVTASSWVDAAAIVAETWSRVQPLVVPGWNSSGGPCVPPKSVR